MFTIRNLGGVALFLFGTIFPLLTPAFATPEVSTMAANGQFGAATGGRRRPGLSCRGRADCLSSPRLLRRGLIALALGRKGTPRHALAPTTPTPDVVGSSSRHAAELERPDR